MAAGGECPDLESLWHRSHPGLPQPWLYLPPFPPPLAAPWCRLELERQSGEAHVAQFSTFRPAGACRDGEYWTGGGCAQERNAVSFALSP